MTSGAASGGAGSAEELGPGSLWADEEEKKFYEELRELRGEVPASILGVPEEEPPVVEQKPDEVAEENGTSVATPDEVQDIKESTVAEEVESEGTKATECV